MNGQKPSILERLNRIKAQISPEEKQILDISDEDIASFASGELLLTGEEMKEAIQDIVEKAYKESPAFKELVQKDLKSDPERLSRSAKLVGKFLRHLRGVLPPQSAAWIKPDAFEQAHDMVKRSIEGVTPGQSPKKPALERRALEPLSEEELSMFGLSRNDLRPGIALSDIVKPIKYFLNKLKDEQGKKVKNEATKNMADEVKKGLLLRLLFQIRNIKLKTKGELKTFEEKWLGKNREELEKIVRGMVEPAPRKEPASRREDIGEVQSDVTELLLLVQKVIDSFKQTKELAGSLKKIGDSVDEALPSTALLEDRISEIQEEAAKLGLTKSQINSFLKVDIDTLTHDPEDINERLQELRKSFHSLSKKKEEKGSDEELVEQMKSLKKQVENIQVLKGKDLSGLSKAVEDYLETLRAFKKNVQEKLDPKKLEDLPSLDKVVSTVEQLIKRFRKLTRQEIFRARWKGVHGRLFGRSLQPQQPEQESSETKSASLSRGHRLDTVGTKMMKTAAFEDTYSEKLSKFKGGGLRETFKDIRDFVSSDKGLIGLRDKLLSIMETSPENRLNPTDKDFRGNPLGGEGPEIGEMEKSLSKFFNDVRKIGLGKKRDEAQDILEWAADLPSHIRAVRKTRKKSSVVDALKKIASYLVQAAPDPDPEDKKTSIKGEGRVEKARPTSEAGWFVYRERLTKMGKKNLRSFFEEPTFVEEFVEAMEKEGLNEMLMKGGEVEELKGKVDPTIEKLLQKASGKKGSFENILGSLAVQEKNVRRDMEKAEKEMEDARKRVGTLNEKILETEKKYLPRLERFVKFMSRPTEAIKEHLQERRKKAPEEKREKERPEVKKYEAEPSSVHEGNFKTLLYELHGRYGLREKSEKPKKSPPIWRARQSAEEQRSVILRHLIRKEGGKILSSVTKRAAEVVLPSKKYKELLVSRKELKALQKDAEKKEDPLEKAKKVRDYIELYLDRVDKSEDYLKKDVKTVLQADRGTLKNLQDFLRSKEGQKQSKKIKEQASSMIDEIHSKIEEEEKYLRTLRDAVEAQKKQIEQSDAEARLAKIKKDIEDGEVEGKYEVAMRPEMHPSPGQLKEIKKKKKEKEKAISYVMDKDRYKNNMNKIMTLYGKGRAAKPVSEYKGKGVPQILPSDRLDELKQKIEKSKMQSGRLPSDAEDPAVKGRRRAFLENQLRDWKAEREKLQGYIDAARRDIEEDTRMMEELDTFISELAQEGEISDDTKERHKKTIDSLKDKISSEQERIRDLEDHLKLREQQIESYRKEYEKFPKIEKKVSPELTKLKEIKERIRSLIRRVNPKPTMKLVQSIRDFADAMKEKGITDKQMEFASHRALADIYERGIRTLPSNRLKELKQRMEEAKEKSGEIIDDSKDPRIVSKKKSILEKPEEVEKIKSFLKSQIRGWKTEKEKLESYIREAHQDSEKDMKMAEDLDAFVSAPSQEGDIPEDIKEPLKKTIDNLKKKIAAEKENLRELEDQLKLREEQIRNFQERFENLSKTNLPSGTREESESLSNLQRTQQEIKNLKGKLDSEAAKKFIQSLRNFTEFVKKSGIPERGSVPYRTLADMYEKGLEQDIDAVQQSESINPQEKVELEKLEKEISQIKQKMQNPGRAKTAADRGELSPYEKALTVHRVKPAPYMKDLPKPKGWDVVEDFFNETRKELKILEKVKAEDWEDVPEETQKEISDRIKDLERIIPRIEDYRNQIVDLGEEAVPLRDVVTKFEDLMKDYMEEMRKYKNQRDDAIKRLIENRQEYRYLKSLFDPKTGEYKGLGEEEIENLKDIFFRMLYREMDQYWSTKIGKRIDVFGERDTAWYNNVYRSFKGLTGVKSNRKLMALLNKYKQETRSDIDDLANRLKSQQLEKRRDRMINEIRELGGDPARSKALNELNTRIKTLKKQEEQINKIFTEMSQAVGTSVHDAVEKTVVEKIQGEKPKGKADLEKMEEKQIEEAATLLEQELNELLSAQKALDQTEYILEKGEAKLGIEPPESKKTKSEKAEKPEEELKKEKEGSYDMNHPDFNSRIFYGPVMQQTIQEMIEKEMSG